MAGGIEVALSDEEPARQRAPRSAVRGSGRRHGLLLWSDTRHSSCPLTGGPSKDDAIGAEVALAPRIGTRVCVLRPGSAELHVDLANDWKTDLEVEVTHGVACTRAGVPCASELSTEILTLRPGSNRQVLSCLCTGGTGPIEARYVLDTLDVLSPGSCGMEQGLEAILPAAVLCSP